MSVKFKVQMTEKYMYDFMLYHNYTSMSGLLSAVAGVLCLVVFLKQGDMQSSIVWLVCAILFLVVSPYTMKTRAKAQVRNTEMFQKPLEYELTEEGITVRQDDQ